MKIKDEKELLKKKILDNYTDFEDFKRNYQDFHKLSEEAAGFVRRLFTPITPDKIIKAIVGWVAVTITLNYLKEIYFWFLFACGRVREWDLFTKPISSLTVAELIGNVCFCLLLLGSITFIYEILKSLVCGWYNWCFCIEAEEVEEEWV